MSEDKLKTKTFTPERGWLTKLDAKIAKTALGDPNFQRLGIEEPDSEEPFEVWQQSIPEDCVLACFTPEQVVYLVNKALYFLNYQKEHHKKRAAEERERLAPVKAKVKELFKTSYINATPEQLETAIEAVAEERKKEVKE